MKKKVIMLVIMISCIFVVGTFSKYVSDSTWDYFLKSKGFYFNSDYLDLKKLDNIDNFWDSDKVYFNVRNNLNDLVITKYDIDYKVNCYIKGEAKDFVNCKLNGTNNDNVTGVLTSIEQCTNLTNDGIDVSNYSKTQCELNEYDWKSQVSKKDMFFELEVIDSSYELSDVIVNIVAESISPYKKVISGDFLLHKVDEEEELVFSFKSYDLYGKLIINNNALSDKCLNIKWSNSDFVIENDDYIYKLDSEGYINEIDVLIESNSNKVIKFFNKGNNNIEDFIFEESNNCN